MSMHSKERSFLSITLSVAGSIAWCTLAPLTPATAQIIPDGTLGTQSSVVTPNVTIKGILSDQIDGGAIRGANLFHSFGEFNTASGRGAYFTNPAGIANIFSLITGTNPSKILGTLGVLGNANLFLINPNGIIFGPNAKLDVGGSFLGSTASGINFADGTLLSAIDPFAPSLLTISIPIGLQYRGNAGSILVQGSKLQVPDGKTLALVGGNLSVDGASLEAAGGRAELGGMAGTGTVGLNINGNNLSLSFPNDVVRADISLTNKAVIDVTGQGGGAIQFQGRQVTFSDESIVSANTLGDQNGQGISIETVQLVIQGGAQVSASTSGGGKGGGIEVNASDLVELSGTSANGQRPSRLASDLMDAAGIAGNVIITTRRLIIQNGARISASASGTGQGQGGTIKINASDLVELIGTSPGDRRPSGVSVQTSRGNAKAGGLRITTSQLSIRNGAEVSAATFGDGQGGTVEVNASDSVELIGTSTNGQLPSRLFAGTGRPSDVRRDGNLPPDRGRGNNPDISTGNGGNLIVKTRLLTVQDGAKISVGSQGSGSAGILEVTANSIRLDNKASLTADTTGGQGNIILSSQDLVLRHSSNITTNARGADKAGGNINIDTGVLVSLENSDITANSQDFRGGNVNIAAQGIFGTQFRLRETPQTSDITATGADSSLSGSVTINRFGDDPSRGLVALPETIADPAALIAQNPCDRGQGSTFVVTGRGGLPSNPSELLNSEVVRVGLVEPAPLGEPDRSLSEDRRAQEPLPIQHPTSNIQHPIVPAQGWVFNDKGEVVLTAYNPASTSSQRPWVNPGACKVP